MPLLTLPQITVTGTPDELGRQHGAALREPIRAFVDQRRRAARAYLRERGIRDAEALLAIGRACRERLRTWDPEGWSEHAATAEAAGVDADELYTFTNYTDVRDVLALPGAQADREGCSTALVPAASAVGGQVIAAQTWDLNPDDLDFVVAIQRRPKAGPATWSVTCAGCQTLVGLSDRGVAVGTTNIKVRGSRPGIPYLSLLHRAVRSADRHEALTAIAEAPRAAAHTYWAADATGVDDLECSADRCVRRNGDRPLNRTNHCLDAGHAAAEGEAPSASSQKRLARIAARLAAGPVGIDDLRALFADRSDGVDSVNRLPEDRQGTTTNACCIAVPARRELHACRGPADRGAWVVLGF